MKIRPVIFVVAQEQDFGKIIKHHQPKQFIDFGGWSLMKKH